MFPNMCGQLEGVVTPQSFRTKYRAEVAHAAVAGPKDSQERFLVAVARRPCKASPLIYMILALIILAAASLAAGACLYEPDENGHVDVPSEVTSIASEAFKVAQRSRKGGSALQSPTCFWSAFGVVLTDFDDLRVCEAVAAGDRAARTLLFDTLDK